MFADWILFFLLANYVNVVSSSFKMHATLTQICHMVFPYYYSFFFTVKLKITSITAEDKKTETKILFSTCCYISNGIQVGWKKIKAVGETTDRRLWNPHLFLIIDRQIIFLFLIWFYFSSSRCFLWFY